MNDKRRSITKKTALARFRYLYVHILEANGQKHKNMPASETSLLTKT
jgi:hypothetical protein